jgi:hypothetical protein
VYSFSAAEAPANILDRPMLKLIAQGVFDGRGVLTASDLTMLCG